jgi:hypothetical protein
VTGSRHLADMSPTVDPVPCERQSWDHRPVTCAPGDAEKAAMGLREPQSARNSATAHLDAGWFFGTLRGR